MSVKCRKFLPSCNADDSRKTPLVAVELSLLIMVKKTNARCDELRLCVPATALLLIILQRFR